MVPSKDDTPPSATSTPQSTPPSSRPSIRRTAATARGVNQGIRNATGLYYKVVDSDDWLDTDALKRCWPAPDHPGARGTAPDLMICNYVYEHVEDGTSHTVRYTNVFPQNRLFDWMPSATSARTRTC